MMKSLLKSLAVSAALAWVGNVSAASLGSLTPPATALIGNSVSGSLNAPDDAWDFTLTADATVSIFVSNIYSRVDGTTFGEITNFGGDLTGPNGLFQALMASVGPLPGVENTTVQTLSFGGLLTAGSYTLFLAGAGEGAAIYAGSMIAAPVPVPAALWLLGSALVGMVGIGRRTATA